MYLIFSLLKRRVKKTLRWIDMNKSVEKLLNYLKERNVKLNLTTVNNRMYELICTKMYRIVQNFWNMHRIVQKQHENIHSSP